MATGISLEDAKSELKVTLNKLNAGNLDSLKDVIDAYSSCEGAEQKAGSNNKKPRCIIFPAIIAVIAIAAFVISAFYPLYDSNKTLENKELFSFIAFAVALASYLATTIREITKALKKTADKEKEWNRFRATAAEASLLIFGLFVIFRLFKGEFTFWWSNVHSDTFALTYLCLILVYLIILHLFVWYNNSPWSISE